MKTAARKCRVTHGKLFYPSRLAPFYILLIIALSALMQSCKKHDIDLPLFGALDLQLVADNIVSPVTVVDAPDNSTRLFVVDQVGKVWVLSAGGTKLTEPFIDVSSKMVALSPQYDERGLLGLAFHPGFKSNGKFYLFYTAPPRAGGPATGVSWNNLTRVSEFKVSQADPNRADISSERIVFEADHPQFNHNGGTIAFGPDGYLYISIGDGGGGNDVGPGHVNDWYETNAGGNGQNVAQNILGKILRIDVNNTKVRYGYGTYGIPADNPFVGMQGKDEIYAYGFRNPYRFSFDMGGQHWLYAGDAGQSLYEEVDVVTKGGNYGWNVKEGTHCFNTDDNKTERSACPVQDSTGKPLIDPVIEVTNFGNPKGGVTNSIVGGNVYRGVSIPFLSGKYIFGFLSGSQSAAQGKILMAKPSLIGLWSYEEIALKSFPGNLGQYLKGFGQGLNGEIYVTTSGEIGPQGNTGKVYKLILVRK